MDNAHTSVRAAESPDGARRANANISPTVIGRAKYPFTPRLCVGPCTLHACLSLPPLLLPPPSLSLSLSFSLRLSPASRASASRSVIYSSLPFRSCSWRFLRKAGPEEGPEEREREREREREPLAFLPFFNLYPR